MKMECCHAWNIKKISSIIRTRTEEANRYSFLFDADRSFFRGAGRFVDDSADLSAYAAQSY